MYKKNLCANMNMINLSLDELNLVAKNRGIKDYENKSEEDLIKIFSKPKPKISIPKKKIKEIEKDFSELRHQFRNKFRKTIGILLQQK